MNLDCHRVRIMEKWWLMAIRVLTILFFSGTLFAQEGPWLPRGGATNYSWGEPAFASWLSGEGATNYSQPFFLGLDGPPSEKAANESALRRGEVIFLLSYPFTFMASMLGYYAAATIVRTVDTGKSDIALSGGFFGLVAVSAAFLSFAIAMDDHSFIESKTQQSENGVTRYVSFGARW